MLRPHPITLGAITIGGCHPFVLIAGPCVIESRQASMRAAERLTAITQKLRVPFIFKSSYDKANRTSRQSFRGPGIDRGLQILSEIKNTFQVPICTDVHTGQEAMLAADIVDVIQVPALLCRQTDLLIAVGETKRIVNLKKGQFMAPWDMRFAIDKVTSTGNKKILLTERGVSFGYNNLVSDMRSLVIMRDFGYPVIYDATHSVQLPGGAGGRSAGERRFITHLTRAAIGCGCDGVFIEVHAQPDKARCDGPNMLAMKDLPKLLESLKKIDHIIKS